jgi:hypothetical protein
VNAMAVRRPSMALSWGHILPRSLDREKTGLIPVRETRGLIAVGGKSEAGGGRVGLRAAARLYSRGGISE